LIFLKQLCIHKNKCRNWLY